MTYKQLRGDVCCIVSIATDRISLSVHVDNLGPPVVKRQPQVNEGNGGVVNSNMQLTEATQRKVTELPALSQRIKQNKLTLSSEYKVQ